MDDRQWGNIKKNTVFKDPIDGIDRNDLPIRFPNGTAFLFKNIISTDHYSIRANVIAIGR